MLDNLNVLSNTSYYNINYLISIKCKGARLIYKALYTTVNNKYSFPNMVIGTNYYNHRICDAAQIPAISTT